jgi:hypothetical protein
LRRGDLTLRILHYQTALAARQPLAMTSLIATINRDTASRMTGIKGARRNGRVCGWLSNVDSARPRSGNVIPLT